MKTFKKTIKGYSVEVETEIDGDPSTECWVEKGSFSASFNSLGQTGVLTSNDGERELIISQDAFDAIEKWAESVGW